MPRGLRRRLERMLRAYGSEVVGRALQGPLANARWGRRSFRRLHAYLFAAPEYGDVDGMGLHPVERVGKPGRAAAHQGIPSWGYSDVASVRGVHCEGRWGQGWRARWSWSRMTSRARSPSGSHLAAVIAALRLDPERRPGRGFRARGPRRHWDFAGAGSEGCSRRGSSSGRPGLGSDRMGRSGYSPPAGRWLHPVRFSGAEPAGSLGGVGADSG